MKKILLFSSLLVLGAIGIFFGLRTSNDPAIAANMADFKDGNIMSDYVMSNKSTMTEAQIQSFLKSKNSCNRGIDHGYSGTTTSGYYYTYNTRDGHYVCMADEVFGSNGFPTSGAGQTAAHIIWQAAQDFNINPQVLLVLLQKEQALVTDTYPSTLEYRSATGYGCPDTAACDSQYFGFINQVRNAANFFRAHLDNNRNWNWGYDIGWNNILYSPNCATRKSVYIENKATAALYIYTPYTPTQEVLNAGYGSVGGCSAYGNRNFWLYFTDWFGSTQNNRWAINTSNQLMTTNKATNKVNPDTLQNVQDLEKGLDLQLPTQTALANGTICYRTAHDTNNSVNACIVASDLGPYVPVYTDIPANEQTKYSLRHTCKLDFTNSSVTNDCVGENTNVVFSKKATVFGTEYLATQSDLNAKNNLVYLAERFVAPSNNHEVTSTRTSVSHTCKLNFPSISLTSQCFPAGTTIVFAQEFELGGVKYLKTKNDFDNNLATVFLAERFGPDTSTGQIPPAQDGNSTTNTQSTKTSLRFTCKLAFPALTLTDQCFDAPITVKFAQEINYNGTKYLKTQHDFDNNFSNVFLAERFR
jgi:hypothetical protein